ncbi:MAG: hypothetical protein ACRD0K_15640 [Egibacteraceae bacterium]
MPQAEITRWLTTLWGGVVVLVAVAALLTLLIVLVKIIDRRVVAVRDTLRAIVGNTANTTLIPQTADGLDLVLAEGLNHHLFLTRVTTGAGTPAGEG